MHAQNKISGDTCEVSRPRLVLRVALAGNRDLPDSGGSLEKALLQLYTSVALRLSGLKDARTVYSVAEYYSVQKPAMRLVSGLAEGGDTLGFSVLRRCVAEGLTSGVEVSYAAVLAGPLEDYRRLRNEDHLSDFDEMARMCEYILELDGILAKPSPDTRLDSFRRKKRIRRSRDIY